MNNPISKLSERQQHVLQCVIDAANEKKHPYTDGIVTRMLEKGHQITKNQCAYDLGVITSTSGTCVFAAKYNNDPKIWIYQAPKAAEVI